MTPKEKAQEIINMLINDGFNQSALKWVAKISVNEIMKNIINTPTNYGASCAYWEQVKIEIENYDSN